MTSLLEINVLCRYFIYNSKYNVPLIYKKEPFIGISKKWEYKNWECMQISPSPKFELVPLFMKKKKARIEWISVAVIQLFKMFPLLLMLPKISKIVASDFFRKCHFDFQQFFRRNTRSTSSPSKAGVVCLHVNKHVLSRWLVTVCTRHFRPTIRICSLTAVRRDLLILTARSRSSRRVIVEIGVAASMLVLNAFHIFIRVRRCCWVALPLVVLSAYFPPRCEHGVGCEGKKNNNGDDDAYYSY